MINLSSFKCEAINDTVQCLPAPRTLGIHKPAGLMVFMNSKIQGYLNIYKNDFFLRRKINFHQIFRHLYSRNSQDHLKDTQIIAYLVEGTGDSTHFLSF